MKKILFSVLIGSFIFGSLLLSSSCTKQYVSPVTVIDTAFNQTVYADIKSSDWTTTDTGKNYTVTINTPEIDNYFNAHGGVVVYFTFDNGVSYEQIPETYNNVSFTYTYTAGGIELYAQSGNGATAITAPNALTAKIVLVSSN